MIGLLAWILLNQLHPRHFWWNALFALPFATVWQFGGELSHAIFVVAVNRGWLP